MTVHRRGALWLAVCLAILPTVACARPAEREPLREVYTPHFSTVPPKEPLAITLRTLAADWRGEPGEAFRQDLMSWQAAAVSLALFVTLAVAFDYRRLGAPRNLDLLLMLLAGVLLFNVMRFFDVLHQRAYLNLLDWVFIGVFAASAMLLVRSLLRVLRPLPAPWTPNLGIRPLAGLAVALLALNLTLTLTREPDDAGWFSNLGAQRLRERGRLPYGDPLLTGTPGAAYGPLLYAAHVPFQIAVSPQPVNARSPARPALGDQSTYYLPPMLATQLCAAAFHLMGVASLFVAARRLAGTRAAWGMVCLYAGSLAVLGIGGREASVAGLTFISHIAPAAMTLVAFAALPWPALAGVLLVLAAGVGFYPAFMGPAWLGYYWRDREARWGFVFGCAATSVIVGAMVLALSQPADGRSTLGTILDDSFGHHTDPDGYGRSPFGFWGQRGGIREALMTPLAGSTFTTPSWLALMGLISASFALARGRSAVELALLSAALAIAATLVKSHATGTYMAWYYGLLLLGVLGGGRAEGAARPKAVARQDAGAGGRLPTAGHASND
jgi:hypothetical protein